MPPVNRNQPIRAESSESTYSLVEITAEKLRALCDRAWPRDLYDVYSLWPIIDCSGFETIFSEKCQVRKIIPTLVEYERNKNKISKAWSESLKHQMKNVPDFEDVFQEVLSILVSIGLS